MSRKICVIGNFSGRNAGDAAILGGLLSDLSEHLKDCKYLIPTINPGFVRKSYARYPVEAIGLLPWNLSLKIFGLPIVRSVLSADAVLVTDAILFDYKLFNPVYNYLSTLSLVLPLAKRKGIPVILYNVSLGPIYTKLGRWCLHRILQSTSLIMLRDRESSELLEKLSLVPERSRLFSTADCALNTVPSDEDFLSEIHTKEGIFGGTRPWMSVNINSYIDVYVRAYRGKGVGTESFLSIMANVIDRIIDAFNVNIVVVVTQPMDIPITQRMLAKVQKREHVKMISNKDYSYQDIAAIFSKMEMHLGMRTHSLILASSVLTPIVGIIATPKNRGYMRSIEQDARMVEFQNFSVDSLFTVLKSTWEQREKIRGELAPIIEREKGKARQAAQYLKDFLKW
ncbi:MAG: polysaccharide pyruvyl transferase family protein [Nitrospiria bacterium]